MLLNDLLSVLIPRIDHSRVVRMFSTEENDNLPLIKSYLVSIQNVSYLLLYSATQANSKADP